MGKHDSKIKEILEKRANVWEQAKAFLDKVESEDRGFSGEEEQTYQGYNDEMGTLLKRAETLKESDAHDERAEEQRKQFESLIRPEQDKKELDERGGRKALNEEFRSFLRGETPGVEIMPDAQQQQPWSDVRALARVSQEQRALVKGTASAGGHLVPTTFHDELLVHLIEMSAILRAGARVFETDSGENIDFPKVTGLSSASQTAEAATIATSNPTFGKLTLGAWKYAVLMDASRELIEDENYDLLPFFAEEGGWAVGNAFGAKLVAGAGTTEPQGIVTGASVGVTGGTGVVGVPTADNLIDLYYSVIAPYRARPAAKWLLNDATVGKVRKIKDTTNQYIWSPGLTANETDTILGKEVLTDPNMPATALNAKSVIFGDISRYYARKVRGVRFERSDHVAFKEDVVTFKVVIRGDGGLADTSGAVKCFVGGAS